MNTKGSDTLVGRLRKAGMYPALIYLLLSYFIFYFVLIECLWSTNMLRSEGQLAFTEPYPFGQFIFHPELVLDQTMTNLQCNTIGLEFLDFNRILF